MVEGYGSRGYGSRGYGGRGAMAGWVGHRGVKAAPEFEDMAGGYLYAADWQTRGRHAVTETN